MKTTKICVAKIKRKYNVSFIRELSHHSELKGTVHPKMKIYVLALDFFLS